MYRGHYTRKFILPVRRAFGPVLISKLGAIVKGFKTRQILKSREVRSVAQQIKEHDSLKLETSIDKNQLKLSR